MGKYAAVEISNKRTKQLRKESNGMQLFFRVDEETGQHYVKAAITSGANLMQAYGLNPYINVTT